MDYDIFNTVLKFVSAISIGALFLTAIMYKRYRPGVVAAILIIIGFPLIRFLINYFFTLPQPLLSIEMIITIILCVFFIQEARLHDEKLGTNIFIESFVEVLEEETGNKFSYYEDLIKKKVEGKNVASYLSTFHFKTNRKENVPKND